MRNAFHLAPEVHKEWRAGARLVIGGLQSSALPENRKHTGGKWKLGRKITWSDGEHVHSTNLSKNNNFKTYCVCS